MLDECHYPAIGSGSYWTIKSSVAIIQRGVCSNNSQFPDVWTLKPRTAETLPFCCSYCPKTESLNWTDCVQSLNRFFSTGTFGQVIWAHLHFYCRFHQQWGLGPEERPSSFMIGSAWDRLLSSFQLLLLPDNIWFSHFLFQCKAVLPVYKTTSLAQIAAASRNLTAKATTGESV